MVAVDLEQLRVLAGCLGGCHVGDALCERDPVVGPGMHAPHDRRDGHLREGVGHGIPLRDSVGATAHEVDRCAVSDLLAGCGTQVEDSGQADHPDDLDRGSGARSAGRQLAPPGGPDGQVAAGTVTDVQDRAVSTREQTDEALLTAARIWGIIRQLAAAGSVTLADKGYAGAGQHVLTQYRGCGKPASQKAANSAHAKLRHCQRVAAAARLAAVAAITELRD